MTSCLLVILGATGDLAKRKLLPALSVLDKKGFLKNVKVACVGRRPWSTKTFLKHTKVKGSFSKKVHYVELDYSGKKNKEFYDALNKISSSQNRIYYLALPPQLFSSTLPILAREKVRGFKRLLFEKPFGTDLKSATTLNRSITRLFKEEEIFRVDHYLGKELVENLLVFRFGNAIFEQIWNKEFIDHISITVSEDLGVEERAGYYDTAGAVRDMIQSHMLQVLAMTAMEAPQSMTANHVRDKKVQVLQKLRRPSKKDVILGQYTSGLIGKKKVKGYKQEKNIPSTSNTETYAQVKCFIDTKRWKGIPFYLTTGKRLSSRYAKIDLVLKDVTCNFFCKEKRIQSPNRISIRIQPDSGISIYFNTKKVGYNYEIEPVKMDFCHHCHFALNTTESYETILHEALEGDQTLFARWDSVAASWKFVDALRKVAGKPVKYRAGSDGPKSKTI